MVIDEIKEIYEEQKRGKMKAILTFIGAYIVMIGMVSVFYGNPLPYKEKILFFESMQMGWMITKGYLLVLCAIVALVVGVGSAICKIMWKFRTLDFVLLQNCDTKTYLEVMEFAVSYGRNITFKGFQKSVFLLVQQRYVLAMIADLKLKEARQYLNYEWVGNRGGRLYRQININLNLIGMYQSQNLEGFQTVFKRAGRAFQNNKIFIAEKFFLEQRYGDAVEVLNNYKEKMAYNEVNRNYLLGRCYDRLGNRQLAEEHMRYTVANGNTMPCREKAKEWLLASSLKLLEQKGELWCGGENIGE